MDFETMIDNVYNELGENEVCNLIIPPPIIEKSTTKINWKNIKDFLKITKTPPDHFFSYLEKNINEKITWFSNSMSDGLLIFNKKIKISDISNIMIKYIKEFVICKHCYQSNTIMQKDTTIRKWKLKCNDCKAEYTLN
jgi:translation initiation factor 2 beta subunit (eIF-2beta)/eIF-5